MTSISFFLVNFKVDDNIIILCNQNTPINKVLKNKQRIVLRQMYFAAEQV